MTEPTTKDIITDENGRKFKRVPVRSAIPLWVAAAVWLIGAFFLPMASIVWILVTAVCSAAAALLTHHFLPKETKLVEIPFYTGQEDLDNTVREIGRSLESIRAACAKFEDTKPESAAQFRAIAATIGKIRDSVIETRQDLPKIRRFLNYYLPLSVKLADKYALLTAHGSDGENTSDALRSIDGALPQLDTAFRRQLDALYTDDALDISTDITVLETLLSRNNLL